MNVLKPDKCFLRQFFILVIIILLGLVSISPIHAIGDGNVDGGGGDLGGGTGSNFWNPGDEGVRVTVVDAKNGTVKSKSIDYTNAKPNDIRINFGKISKTAYVKGTKLKPSTGKYVYKNPSTRLPSIISINGANKNIKAIRKYFTDEGIVRKISTDIGFSFNTLVNGNYKLLLEPIVYLTYNGKRIAGTATEIAMYDRILKGDIGSKMSLLTQMNLPLSMYLEKADLGYPAWKGTTTWVVDNDKIISSLGLGIVKFPSSLAPAPEATVSDYTYHTDIDVITAITVKGGASDPDNPVTVTFTIDGTKYKVNNIYYPDGSSQLVWVKWHTPSTAKDMTIPVEIKRGTKTTKKTIKVKIEGIADNPPPDPGPNDRNPYFIQGSLPNQAEKKTASWTVWETYKSGGVWKHRKKSHSASLNIGMTITPDSKVPTRNGKQMKSGYGYNNLTTASVTTTQSSAVTGAQNAITKFPEFRYETYSRLLERTTGGMNARFEFKRNQYSTYNRRVHFSPVWYPDGAYTAHTYVIDCWTPVGMLKGNVTDTLAIKGSVYDDWHTAPINP